MGRSAAEPRQAPPAVILAAGRGTRMRSATPKLLHRVAGKPLLSWVLQNAREVGCSPIVLVVGQEGARLRESIGDGKDLLWVDQDEPLGTGDAVARTSQLLKRHVGTVFVLSGDAPLLRPATLRGLAAAAGRGWGAVAVAEVGEAGSLGRVIQTSDASLERIVEAANATPGELALRTVNSGHYALPLPELYAFLERVGPDSVKREVYLTEALNVAASEGRRIACVPLQEASEAWGVNDRGDLAKVHQELLRRKAAELMAEGVTLLDPSSTVVEPGVKVGGDCVLHPRTTLLGTTAVGARCELFEGSWLRNSTLEEDVEVAPYSVLDGAQVGRSCRVGPFARLRPGTRLAAEVRIGNFVEVKQCELGRGAKASHLTYLGDARIGPGANIGAGVVTCNYDGRAKHRTDIGRGAFIGSDTMLVAPVSVGDEALTAAGSVITDDVPAGALGIGRARQETKEGWVKRRRKKDGSG